MNRVTEAIAELRKRARVPPAADRRGPVPLDQFFQAVNATHVALPGLTLGAAAQHLIEERYVSSTAVEELLDDRLPLAGLMFRVGDDGLAFVKADDILPRRRFTAAHELGHAILHREEMQHYVTDATISESDDAATEMEREANRFAAELLMPEEVCRARETELKEELRIGVCPRIVLAYRLASELLVSREAMRYRLKMLGVGDDD